ncbi:MAG: PIN domain-containing protein [Nanoarchaeota archaeon]
MVKIKCLDTYALIEISNGNQKFMKYLDLDFVITDLILVEFYAVILREYNEETADYWYKKLESYSVSIEKLILIEAIKFKYKHRKTNISFFDSVGYIFSLKNNYFFVTGDKEFENFDNVEFMKK